MGCFLIVPAHVLNQNERKYLLSAKKELFHMVGCDSFFHFGTVNREEQKRHSADDMDGSLVGRPAIHKMMRVLSMQRVRSRKLKNSMFKRLSKSEERKSLLEAAPTVEDEKKVVSDDEEQQGCGCFTSWLVYVFIKIFD